MTIDSADDSKISNRTINTNRISNRTYDSKSNRIRKLRRSLVVCRGVLGGICWYTPYTNLRCFLTAYTYLICQNKLAYTGIYRRLVSSVYPPLFLAIHHWLCGLDMVVFSLYCSVVHASVRKLAERYAVRLAGNG